MNTLLKKELPITYSDYNYLIDLFKDEYNYDEIMTKSKIDEVLKFSQSTTTSTFLQEILNHSNIIILTDTQIDNHINHLNNKMQNTDIIDKSMINQVIEQLTHIKEIPMKQRPIYYRDSLNFDSPIDKLVPITYASFIDELTNVPMKIK